MYRFPGRNALRTDKAVCRTTLLYILRHTHVTRALSRRRCRRNDIIIRARRALRERGWEVFFYILFPPPNRRYCSADIRAGQSVPPARRVLHGSPETLDKEKQQEIRKIINEETHTRETPLGRDEPLKRFDVKTQPRRPVCWSTIARAET